VNCLAPRRSLVQIPLYDFIKLHGHEAKNMTLSDSYDLLHTLITDFLISNHPPHYGYCVRPQFHPSMNGDWRKYISFENIKFWLAEINYASILWCSLYFKCSRFKDGGEEKFIGLGPSILSSNYKSTVLRHVPKTIGKLCPKKIILPTPNLFNKSAVQSWKGVSTKQRSGEHILRWPHASPITTEM